jgi:methyl-accepting chemotaxis protein
MAEQTQAMREIATAAETMRTQSEQTARAVKEQASALKEMTARAHSALKQIKLITNANREHSTVSGAILSGLNDVRTITDRNVHGVKRTRGGTDDLRRRADALVALVNTPARQPRRRTNGRA